ncbi:MAG: NAD(P)-dependent oxidoreductase [Alphaproteobacteria bacterium]|nr:NAD(P)-dependent oxidoreductase [Alphaproteobacteria bacterium]
MTVLVIGKNAFLASHLGQFEATKDWLFWGHEEAINASKWPEGISCVVNFAYDPLIRKGGLKGRFSDLDRQFARKIVEAGAHYIMLSSRAVYGQSDGLRHFREGDAPVGGMTPDYGRAKRLIEEDLLSRFGEKVTILRLSNVFGYEYLPKNPRQSFFGRMLVTLREKGVIAFDMSGSTCRDFLPLPDFTSALVQIVKAPKAGIYNLGSGQGISVEAIAKWVLHGYGGGEIVYSSDKPKDQFVLDMTKTTQSFDIAQPSLADIRGYCIQIGQKLRELP